MDAQEISIVIGAGLPVLTAAGGGVRWIVKRFDAVDKRLDECQDRELRSQKRRGIMLSVIELLWQALEQHVPQSPALKRSKSLLDEMKDL